MKIRMRGLRQVTHYYVTDTIELDPGEFEVCGAPSSSTAFQDWVWEHQERLSHDARLSEVTRLKLSKLGFYTEDRDRRVDRSAAEPVPAAD